MLADRAAALTAKIVEYENQRREVGKAEQYGTRANQLTTPAQRLVPLADIRARFRQRGITVNLDERLIAGLSARVQQFAEEYKRDPESITAPDGQLRHSFWDTLKGLSDAVEAALRNAWSDHLDRQLSSGNEELLTILKRVPGFAEVVQGIQRAIARANALNATLPQSEAVINEVDALAVELKAAWDQLHSDEILPPIQAFLRASSQGRATLEQITPEVLDWIVRHRLLAAFRVTL